MPSGYDELNKWIPQSRLPLREASLKGSPDWMAAETLTAISGWNLAVCSNAEQSSLDISHRVSLWRAILVCEFVSCVHIDAGYPVFQGAKIPPLTRRSCNRLLMKCLHISRDIGCVEEIWRVRNLFAPSVVMADIRGCTCLTSRYVLSASRCRSR